MRRLTTCAAIVVVLILATMTSGCWFGGCELGNENGPHEVPPRGLGMDRNNHAAVGVPLQLHAWVVYDPINAINQQRLDFDAAQMGWVVQPSDGAVVSSTGLFKATKPGTYTVTVSCYGYTASAEVFATDEGSTTTVEPTETSEEETTTTEVPTTEVRSDEVLAGDWSWTGVEEINGVFGPSSKAYTFRFVQEAGGWALYYQDTRLCPVSYDGKNVSFTVDIMGSATMTGVLKGDAITGIQVHQGGKWEGPWNATRVP